VNNKISWLRLCRSLYHSFCFPRLFKRLLTEHSIYQLKRLALKLMRLERSSIQSKGLKPSLRQTSWLHSLRWNQIQKRSYLVPGGQWYLCALQSGRGAVIAHDLNSPNAIPYELIPPGNEGNTRLFGVAFSATEAKGLSIKIAVVIGPEGKATPMFQEETDTLVKTV
jgi:hypothetical protein